MHLIIPKNYNPVLNLRDTEIAIKLVKDFFETELAMVCTGQRYLCFER